MHFAFSADSVLDVSVRFLVKHSLILSDLHGDDKEWWRR